MKARHHLAVSCAVSALLYLSFRSLPVALWSFIGGTLIDLDHIYDYARHPERPAGGGFELGHFFDVVGGCRLKRVYVLLHSWELVAAMLLLGWCAPAAGAVLIPMAFGMGIHVILDACANPATVASYSLIGRMFNCFSGDYFFKR